MIVAVSMTHVFYSCNFARPTHHFPLFKNRKHANNNY